MAWGLNCALLPYLGPRQSKATGFEPRTAALLDASGIPILTPDGDFSCDILLAHHPNVFEFMPSGPVSLRPERVVCVLHHPLFDGAKRPQYDIGRIARSLEATFAAPVVFAPISPIVRAQVLNSGVPQSWLLRHDLCNVVDERDWPERRRPAPSERAVIGRHSRSDPLKWPATAAEILAAYPQDSRFDIRVLGDIILPESMAVPPNWTTRPFSTSGVAEFLSGLDFYVYFHHERWIEAFGLSIAEAMVTGLVTILPPALEPIFQDGAVYGHPQDVEGILTYFMERPDEYARQSRAARRVILSRHSIASYKARIEGLCDDLQTGRPILRDAPGAVDTSGPAKPLVPARPVHKKRVLMVAGNGIGLGHITRLMAITRRLPDWVEPVFLTLSLGTSLLREAGYSADFIPTHRKLGVSDRSWNELFALEMLATIDTSCASMVVFDGSCPFPGIVKIMELRRDIIWVWVRRGLWQPHQELSLQAENLVDMVIEPGELAADEDGGATANGARVERVGPILLVDPADRADRQTALEKLGIDGARPVVALQLGSGQNFNMAPIRSALIAALKSLPVSVIEIENPLAAAVPDPIQQTRSLYPMFPWSRAIDLMVTTPGYNAFHENTFGGVPTIFVPNEAPEMDDQLLRAAYAHSAGLGLMMTTADAPRAATFLARGLDAGFARMVRQRAERRRYENGAVAAARLITDFLISVRTDRPLHSMLPRNRPLS